MDLPANSSPFSPSICLKDECTVFLHYNYTGKLAHRSQGSSSDGWAMVAALIVLCILVALENLMVLAALFRAGKLRSPSYCLIGSLAVADMMAAAAYAANVALSGSRTLTLSPEAWFAREGGCFAALAASVFGFLALAVERCLAVGKFKPASMAGGGTGLGPKWIAQVRVTIVIVTCWLCAGLLAALPIIGWNCLGNMDDCSMILPLYAKSYLLFCISLFSLVMVLAVCLYISIYRAVCNGDGNVSKNQNPGSQTSRRSLALHRTLIIVVGVFIVCWAPLFAFLAVDVACNGEDCPILFKANAVIILAVLNSGANPVIYAASSREMRRAFKRLICCCCSHKKSSTSSADGPSSGSSASTFTRTSGGPCSPLRRGFGPGKVKNAINTGENIESPIQSPVQSPTSPISMTFPLMLSPSKNHRFPVS
uniref:sphingosine 1-phosphate receptor 3-like n=1 Tax=Myxine glutinosa TaxID=7769 RepID=UPI00358F1417